MSQSTPHSDGSSTVPADGSDNRADRGTATSGTAPGTELEQAASATGDHDHTVSIDEGKQAELLALQTRVSEGLDELRAAFLQVIDGFALDVTGRISQVETAVRGRAAGPATRRLRSDLTDLAELVASLKVKPRKGRRRDLKRIERLVAELENVTDGWE